MVYVDVVLVTYNQEKFIADAVESILIQKVKDDVQLNLIIADDCSTDNTLDIIKSYLPDISYAYQILDTPCNLGISKNYKRIFEFCTGDYIAILEGDDYWVSPNHIEDHIRFLEKYRFCCLSMNSFVIKVQDNNEFFTPNWTYSNDYKFIDTKTQIIQGNQLGNLSACVLRTTSVKQLPSSIYELSIADWMLGVMLSQYGLLALLKEPSSVYRMNSQSKWASLTPNEQKERLIKLSIEYDNFQEGKFHRYWDIYRKKLNRREPSKLRKILRKIKSILKKI